MRTTKIISRRPLVFEAHRAPSVGISAASSGVCQYRRHRHRRASDGRVDRAYRAAVRLCAVPQVSAGRTVCAGRPMEPPGSPPRHTGSVCNNTHIALDGLRRLDWRAHKHWWRSEDKPVRRPRKNMLQCEGRYSTAPRGAAHDIDVTAPCRPCVCAQSASQ